MSKAANKRLKELGFTVVKNDRPLPSRKTIDGKVYYNQANAINRATAFRSKRRMDKQTVDGEQRYEKSVVIPFEHKQNGRPTTTWQVFATGDRYYQGSDLQG